MSSIPLDACPESIVGLQFACRATEIPPRRGTTDSRRLQQQGVAQSGRSRRNICQRLSHYCCFSCPPATPAPSIIYGAADTRREYHERALAVGEMAHGSMKRGLDPLASLAANFALEAARGTISVRADARKCRVRVSGASGMPAPASEATHLLLFAHNGQ